MAIGTAYPTSCLEAPTTLGRWSLIGGLQLLQNIPLDVPGTGMVCDCVVESPQEKGPTTPRSVSCTSRT